MIVTIDIRELCGVFCSDGNRAASIRSTQIDPYINVAEQIVLDFAGVRNMNSSFCNVLIGNLFMRHGELAMQKLRFANCNETVQVHIRSALSIGLSAARLPAEQSAT